MYAESTVRVPGILSYSFPFKGKLGSGRHFLSIRNLVWTSVLSQCLVRESANGERTASLERVRHQPRASEVREPHTRIRCDSSPQLYAARLPMQRLLILCVCYVCRTY